MTRFPYGLSCLALSAALLAGCSSKSSDSAGNQASVQPAAATAQPAPAAAPAVPATPDARTVAVNVQGVAPVGLTVRVKGIELGSDATMLTVSASYGGTTTNDVKLASDPTYLQDEQGNKLMLKPPQDNPELNIVRGQQMDGTLVFLGAIPAGTRSVKLVINNGNPGDSIIAPGLTIALPLEKAGQ